MDQNVNSSKNRALLNEVVNNKIMRVKYDLLIVKCSDCNSLCVYMHVCMCVHTFVM